MFLLLEKGLPLQKISYFPTPGKRYGSVYTAVINISGAVHTEILVGMLRIQCIPHERPRFMDYSKLATPRTPCCDF